MKVLITGGCGYVGQWLAKALLERGELEGAAGPAAIDEIVLFDAVTPTTWLPGLPGAARVVTGDVAKRQCQELAGMVPDSVFHLASVVSGDGERDFDKAITINMEGITGLLEGLRHANPAARFVFASSIAAFGLLPDRAVPVGDTTKQIPATTYGMTKAMGELLVNDYSRKGFVDGRSARLPTVIVRAGKANLAASSFCSGVLREPLAGVDAVLPVAREQPMPLSGYRSVVAGLIALHELPGERLGLDRAVGLPALNVTAGELVDCSSRLRAQRPGMGEVHQQIDPVVAKICAGWPTAVDNSRAQELGLPMPASLDDLAAEYIADFIDVA